MSAEPIPSMAKPTRISATEAGRLLGCSSRTVTQMVETGKLTRYRAETKNLRYRYDEQEILRLKQHYHPYRNYRSATPQTRKSVDPIIAPVPTSSPFSGPALASHPSRQGYLPPGELPRWAGRCAAALLADLADCGEVEMRVEGVRSDYVERFLTMLADRLRDLLPGVRVTGQHRGAYLVVVARRAYG
ncbi:MAG: hypothetical protein LC772_06710 [Chloroflexi bacterium]|nr:hypothetical protein [Chloroflexota bacterium]